MSKGEALGSRAIRRPNTCSHGLTVYHAAGDLVSHPGDRSRGERTRHVTLVDGRFVLIFGFARDPLQGGADDVVAVAAAGQKRAETPPRRRLVHAGIFRQLAPRQIGGGGQFVQIGLVDRL